MNENDEKKLEQSASVSDQELEQVASELTDLETQKKVPESSEEIEAMISALEEGKDIDVSIAGNEGMEGIAEDTSTPTYSNMSDEEAIHMGQSIIDEAKATIGDAPKVKRYRLKRGMGIKLGAVLSVFVVVGLLGLGNSFGWFTSTTKGKTGNDVEAAVFEVSYEGGKDAISLENAYPIPDSEGLQTTPYQFKVTNKGTVAAVYQLTLSEHSITSLDRNFLKYTLKKNDGEESAPIVLSNLTLIENQTLEPGQSDTYELKVWLKEDATNDAMGKRWVSKVQVVSREQ